MRKVQIETPYGYCDIVLDDSSRAVAYAHEEDAEAIQAWFNEIKRCSNLYATIKEFSKYFNISLEGK